MTGNDTDGTGTPGRYRITRRESLRLGGAAVGTGVAATDAGESRGTGSEAGAEPRSASATGSIVVEGGDGVSVYRVAVSGTIERDRAASDSGLPLGGVGESEVVGAVAAGRDVYHFSGDVTDRTVQGDATVTVIAD